MSQQAPPNAIDVSIRDSAKQEIRRVIAKLDQCREELTVSQHNDTKNVRAGANDIANTIVPNGGSRMMRYTNNNVRMMNYHFNHNHSNSRSDVSLPTNINRARDLRNYHQNSQRTC